MRQKLFPTGLILSSIATLGFFACTETRFSQEESEESLAMRTRHSSSNLGDKVHLVVLDADAIAVGLGSHPLTPDDINADSSRIGYRDVLAYFAEHLGQEITLPGGEMGDEGWFGFTSVRHSWKMAGPDSEDGLRNYFEAGPGLGSPDARGREEFLLQKVTNVTPLRATGLARLEGRAVCAVVMEGDVKMSYRPTSADLSGKNLGTVAFEVVSTQRNGSAGSNALPAVTVRILDAERTCQDRFHSFEDAPRCHREKDSSDIVRPECVNDRVIFTENWDRFDSTRWIGDGDELVADGALQARPGANSTAADHISAVPIPIENSGSIVFSNRMQLNSTQQNSFAESGALFMVNLSGDGSYNQYVFVNVGYTLAPSLVFVELFGSDNGVDFDQFEETSLTYQQSQIFTVDLVARRNSYAVGIGGEMIDTVNLSTPVPALQLFEVGVQQNAGGLRGLVLATTLTQTCIPAVPPKPRCHSSFKGKKWKKRVSPRCKTRNDYVRWARQQIQTQKNPSHGVRCLAKMKLRPEFDG
jgi:hypothetical protein